MNNLRVLDVTLRDGGCVNDFNFGQNYMKKIIAAQEAAGIDVIEVGYIDENKGSVSGRTQYINERVITESILRHKKAGIEYVAMVDYGKFPMDKLQLCKEDGIDGIRMAFHKKDRMEVIKLGRKMIEKGYKFYIQPMITLRYSDEELIEFINIVNNELPDASGFYIVDSFGEMRPNDMSRILNLVDHNLIPSMTLGFHSHNNLQLSYSNAIAMLQFPTLRNIMIDCSIMGMGKGAGNLNTELLLEHLNLYYGKKYRVAPLLEVIDEVINQIHNEFYWGYAPEYYLSSANHCTPSYASHFYNKHMLPIDQVGELLGMIADDKKISFDKSYADQLYYNYNAVKFDDTETIKILKDAVRGKKILLVAPGKSVNIYKEKLVSLANDPDIITIAINNVPPLRTTYYFASKSSALDNLKNYAGNVITTSNVTTDKEYMVINYSSWIEGPEGKSDAAITIIGNILTELGTKEIMLAGFDGFNTDADLNYYDEELKRPMTRKDVNERNSRTFMQLQLMSKHMKITFVTPSIFKEKI